MKPNGPAAAALISAGVGVFVLGLLALLSETVGPIHDFLPWVQSVGPLSGKVFITMIVWVVLWPVLHVVLRRSDPSIDRAAALTAGLVIVGVGMMLPPVWGLFGA